MTSIVGPFAGVENDYRRERITGSFREHKRGARHLFHRRVPKGAAEPVVDWWGGE